MFHFEARFASAKPGLPTRAAASPFAAVSLLRKSDLRLRLRLRKICRRSKIITVDGHK